MKGKFQPKRLLLLCLVLFLGLQGWAQGQTLSGRVTGEDGTALQGVSVILQGTSSGTVTDAKGNFKLAVSGSGGSLIFSNVGFTPQILPVGRNTVFAVALVGNNSQLTSVVVTALGIEKQKKTIGFSAQELGKKDLSDGREVNVADYLTGKIAGLQVSKPVSGTGGSSKVIIRGVSSLVGENQPLYVVDGIPLDNTRNKEAFKNNAFDAGHDYGDGIGNINPQDIESMTVLKGPNATALYGARGSNGVILITTKSGKNGHGPTVEVNSNVAIEKINLIPKVQNTYSLGYEDKNSYGSIVNIDGQNYETLDPGNTDSYGQRMDGTLFVNPFVFDKTAAPTTFKLLPQPESNIRDFWQTGLTTNNSVAVSGGNERSSARLSANNISVKGITPNNSENMQTVTLRVGTKVNDKLSFDGKVNYIHKNLYNAPTLGTSLENLSYNLATLGRFVPLDFLKDYYDKTGQRGNFPNVLNNPYYVVDALKNTTGRDRVIAFGSVKYQFAPWLFIMGRAGEDVYSDHRSQTWPVGAQGSANINGRIINETYLTNELNSDVLLTATKSNIRNFVGTLSLGASLLKRRNTIQGWDGNTFKVPGIYDISNAKNSSPYYSLIRREMQSVYFSGQLAYKNYLFLDVTGRNDWSSTLGVNNYSFFYPSVSGSFVFTDALNIHSNTLSFGKIRASYAEAGNDAQPYLTESGYFLNSIPINGQSYGFQSGTIPLFNLKNELKSSVEFGLDIRFFGDRIGLDATYYKSNTKNQIVPIAISNSSGYSTQVVNAGNIQNEGLELTLRLTPVQLRNSFRWDLAFNFSNNHSKVLELAPGIESFLLFSGQPNTIEARVGQPWGNIVGYKYKRSPTGQIVVNDGGGYYEREDNPSVLGNVTPKWIGGLVNNFTFKGFSLNTLVDFVQGNKITSTTKYQMEAKGTGAFTVEGREHSKPLDGVVEQLDGSGNVQGYTKNAQLVDGQTYWANRAWSGIGEEFVLNGSYIMLREVILGYTFQPSLMKKTPFTSLKLSVVGRNLWYIEEHMQGMGISPETTLNTQASTNGVEAIGMPSTRGYGVNLSFTF